MRILEEGDMFGEIGLLTKLPRTCHVETLKTCFFQTLSRQALEDIQEQFPTVLDKIKSNMHTYNDEIMSQRRQFVSYVPYLRGLPEDIITEITFKMKQQVYEFGEQIVKSSEVNTNIIIVWNGTLQMRVSRFDPDSNVSSDFWIGNIHKGACIDVYNCFQVRHTSLVKYVVSSRFCTVQLISLQDLRDLAKHNIKLQDRLQFAELKIQTRMVDDIDYFAFPKKYLPENHEIFNQICPRMRYLNSKKIMLKRILWYAKKIRKGELKFPKALDVLQQVQKDRLSQRKDNNLLQLQFYEQQSQSFNIMGLFQQFKNQRYKERILLMEYEQQEFDSDHEILTPTTICTQTSSKYALKELDKDKEQDGDQQEKNRLLKEKQLYQTHHIQRHKGLNVIQQAIQNHTPLTTSFLKQIEKYVFEKRNFEIFQEVLTKEADQTFQFRLEISISMNNIQNIFTEFHYKDFKKISHFINREDGQIWSKQVKKAQMQKLKSQEQEMEKLIKLQKPKKEQKENQGLEMSPQKIENNQEYGDQEMNIFKVQSSQQIVFDINQIDHLNSKSIIPSKKISDIVEKAYLVQNNEEIIEKNQDEQINENKEEEKEDEKPKSRFSRFKSFGKGGLKKMGNDTLQKTQNATKTMADNKQFGSVTNVTKNMTNQAQGGLGKLGDLSPTKMKDMANAAKDQTQKNMNKIGDQMSPLKNVIKDGIDQGMMYVEEVKELVGLGKKKKGDGKDDEDENDDYNKDLALETEQTEEEEDEVEEELVVDPQQQNYVYSDTFMIDYQNLQDQIHHGKQQSKIISRIQKAMKEQEALLQSLKQSMDCEVKLSNQRIYESD